MVDAVGIMSGVMDSVMIIFLMVALLGVIFYFIWYKAFNVTFIARKLVSGRTIIKVVKARITTDKEGKEVIKFFKSVFGVKRFIVPPQEAQDVDIKGKVWVEAYYVDGQGFTYVDFPCKTDDKINPFDIDDRNFLINEFAKADERAGFDILKNLPQIVAIGAALTLVIMLMIMYGDIAEPLLVAHKEVKEMQEVNIKLLDKIDDILNDQQTLTVDFQDTKQDISNSLNNIENTATG